MWLNAAHYFDLDVSTWLHVARAQLSAEPKLLIGVGVCSFNFSANLSEDSVRDELLCATLRSAAMPALCADLLELPEVGKLGWCL